MKSYEVSEDVRVDMVDPGSLERFEFEAKAGKRNPKNEREEAALEHLAALGFAEAPKPKSKPKTEE